ncbi:hypothetical protein EN844_09090 [Mesorhizobium sp. M3A.F.Ca.ET.201.01.1.1]|uniref:hypothetical protein n=1 Tax=unclassified Mesorhizobium TaxID=325217 RepID=UPI000FE7A74B|nr:MULTISPECIES: hypothetical protein [unclassified Mesorhizobium]RWE30042.1 MAG: hypothetical protein EOS77_21075 [Mesorhizobium sp.]TGS69022.1 hypothetical protein EN844_09090 [Mesorhizobium sp. M3A.F.Ca.ET.201.01.1.1]
MFSLPDAHIIGMLPHRLRVSKADDRYQVADESGPIRSFDTIVEAVRFVRDREARLWLDWGRTIIGGQTVPHDFSPTFLGSPVGRIQGEAHGTSAGTWRWSIATHDKRWRSHGGQRGQAYTKDEAVAELEQAFTKYIAETPERPSPYSRKSS